METWPSTTCAPSPSPADSAAATGLQKIPTLFERDKPPWRRPVTPGVKPECLWVAAGEGIATRKLDGINVKVVDGIPVPGENVVGPSRAGDLAGDRSYGRCAESIANGRTLLFLHRSEVVREDRCQRSSER